jgi:hypothetical protein
MNIFEKFSRNFDTIDMRELEKYVYEKDYIEVKSENKN